MNRSHIYKNFDCLSTPVDVEDHELIYITQKRNINDIIIELNIIWEHFKKETGHSQNKLLPIFEVVEEYLHSVLFENSGSSHENSLSLIKLSSLHENGIRKLLECLRSADLFSQTENLQSYVLDFDTKNIIIVKHNLIHRLERILVIHMSCFTSLSTAHDMV